MLQTGVPPGVWRNSGSFVRLPTRTTRLIFAMSYSSSSPGCSSGAASSSGAAYSGSPPSETVVSGAAASGSAASGAGVSGAGVSAGAARSGSRRFGGRVFGRRRHGRGGLVAWRARARAGDVARGQVAQHGVLDLEDAGHLLERRRLRVEDDEVVDALLLVRNRIREAPPAPGVVAVPRPAALLDEVAGAGDDVVLAGLGLLGVQHQQNFVSRHAPMSSLPMVSMCRPRLRAPLGTARRDDGAGSAATVASARC